VILPSFNFLAAPAAVVWAGLRPVFVDVDPRTFTVDAAAVKAAITPRTAAILACHTFGCPCDMSALTAIAGTAGVPLVVDAAHGLGSTQEGRQVGAGGLAQVFSMSPTKLVVAGEGGVVATSCGCLADALRIGREYGNDGGYDCDRAGLNARLPELSAILGRASLARLPVVAARRREVADTYIEVLRDEPGIGFQAIPPGSETSWKDFCIAIDPGHAGMDRDALRAALASRGIDTRAYYSPACHRMPAFAPFFAAGHSLPVTDRLAATLVALPMGGHVTPDVAALVGREIRQVLSGSRRTAGA
jgi:dTDP-4-amino-4,6-dideoxygalactose transaminase